LSMKNRINLFERRRTCTAGAKPESNSIAKQCGLYGEASGERATLKGKGELGGENRRFSTPEAK
jgi:hypothetical protein